MTFGQKLRGLRTKADLTTVELAERAGMNPVALYALEKGNHCPMLSTAKRLAKALRVSLEEFDGCALPIDGRTCIAR